MNFNTNFSYTYITFTNYKVGHYINSKQNGVSRLSVLLSDKFNLSDYNLCMIYQQLKN